MQGHGCYLSEASGHFFFFLFFSDITTVNILTTVNFFGNYCRLYRGDVCARMD